MRLKLNLIGRPVVPADRLQANIDRCRSLNLPTVKDRRGTRTGPLHIVGGGPSSRRWLGNYRGITDYREPVKTQFATLPPVEGDVWAINGTCPWLRSEGIEAVFFSCDALPEVAEFARGARWAVVAEQCDPSVFDVLLEGGADIITFDCAHGEIVGTGSTTATATPMTGAILGFRQFIFYGCEGSYERGRTHADRHEPRAEELVVELGGEEFLTAPDFLKQCEELSAMFHMERRESPGTRVFQELSGGLLRQMIEHGHDYAIRWLSPTMRANIEQTMKELAAA